MKYECRRCGLIWDETQMVRGADDHYYDVLCYEGYVKSQPRAWSPGLRLNTVDANGVVR